MAINRRRSQFLSAYLGRAADSSCRTDVQLVKHLALAATASPLVAATAEPGLVLVTGASGFVGRGVVASLARSMMDGRLVRAAWRRAMPAAVPPFAPNVQVVRVGDLTAETDWRGALAGASAVVHCAARVHVLRETAGDPLAEFRRVNVAGTLQLARQAAAAGVQRFVFLSSIGVNGATTSGAPFTADDVPAPRSAYAQAKFEAETGLRALAAASGLEVTIIRPPLVFGPGAPGNFGRLMRALQRGLPLPFGAVHNQRSLVSLDNLVSLIETCLDHPAAANQTFLVSDGDDISTTALLKHLARALGTPARLIPVPIALLAAGARLIGKPGIVQQLCGSLQLDIAKTRTVLGWAPVRRLSDALDDAAHGFLAGQAK